MATDAYIKFGECDGKGPNGTPLPAIEGDSTDTWHYWWCELRSCGFDLEATDWKPDEDDSAAEDKDKKRAKAKFKPVTLKKRVDWASTQLFRECCEQSMALSKPSKEEREKGWFDQVTVEICRHTGTMVKLGDEEVPEKIPFVTVKYFGVRLTNYEIEMSGPEPTESITFEFQKLEFDHQRTDPYTGLKVPKDGATRTGPLANSAPGQSGTAPGGDGAPTASSPAPLITVAPPGASPTTGSPGSANGSPAPPAPTIDVAVAANFPGLWQGTGFGVLPD